MPTLKEILREAMTRRGITVHELALKLGIRDQQIYLVMKKNACNFKTLCLLMDALGLEIRPKDQPPPTVG